MGEKSQDAFEVREKALGESVPGAVVAGWCLVTSRSVAGRIDAIGCKVRDETENKRATAGRCVKVPIRLMRLTTKVSKSN